VEQLAPWVFLVGCLSALCTGLGAIPALWVPHQAGAARGVCSAVAAGMMLGASVFSLAAKGFSLPTPAPLQTLLGLALGALLVYVAHTRLHRPRGALLFFVMLIHSIPEGIAVGVAFATEEVRFGWIVALAISVHNIPEGVAVSLALAAEGAGFWKCFWMSVLTSLPQALLAVPAFLAAWFFRPLLPIGLGLAAGAMLLLVARELLPQALEETGSARTIAGVVVGASVMVAVSLL
jgi:zinc transporter, ZIP family